MLPGSTQKIGAHRHNHNPGFGHELPEFSGRHTDNLNMGGDVYPGQQVHAIGCQNALHRQVAHCLEEKSIIAVRIASGEYVASIGNLIRVVIKTVMMGYEPELASRQSKCFGVAFPFHRSPDCAAIHLPQAEPHPCIP